MKIFSVDGSGDNLENEGRGEHCAAAGDGEPVVLRHLGVEWGQQGQRAASQEDRGAECNETQETLPPDTLSLWGHVSLLARIVTIISSLHGGSLNHAFIYSQSLICSAEGTGGQIITD